MTDSVELDQIKKDAKLDGILHCMRDIELIKRIYTLVAYKDINKYVNAEQMYNEEIQSRTYSI